MREEVCVMCQIPRSAYDLRPEPGVSNPDLTMPLGCQFGHVWVTITTKEESK